MYSILTSGHDTKLILRGIHLGLTDAMKVAITTKAERLFRHEPAILRLRIDVEPSYRNHGRVFTAKGLIEIAGPDLQASTTASDAYNAIDLLIGTLDRLLRKRTTARRRRRTTDDIRAHTGAVAHA